ncbi:MAG: hypothetical protein K6F46_09975 [Desulfovibrio sp.]|nr:hypothetical protein [Desulfovibrio sp.]
MNAIVTGDIRKCPQGAPSLLDWVRFFYAGVTLCAMPDGSIEIDAPTGREGLKAYVKTREKELWELMTR